MNQIYCEREAEILEALRGGALAPELANHAASCTICLDTLAVSEFFQAGRSAALAPPCDSEQSEESWLDLNTSTVDKNPQFCAGLPDSDFLWWKAQLARKQSAVERATCSIAMVRKVSYVGAAAAGLWFAFSPGPLSPILNALSRREIWVNGALSQSALFLGIAALVFTLVGSLYLARPEK
jgi:hypothetical protein